MRDILTKSYLWLCMFLCFYIPFIPVVHALSSIVMGLLVVIALFIVEKPKAKMIFVNRTTTAFIILFLIIALQSLFGNHFVNDFAELRKIGQTALLIILFSIIKSPQNEALFKLLGVDHTVTPMHLAASRIEEDIEGRPLVHLMNLQTSSLELLTVTIPPLSAVIDKSLGNIKLPPNSFVSLIVKKTSKFIS